MFDFSTENVLNDLSRVSVLTAAEDPTLTGAAKALYVKRLNKFRDTDVETVWKDPAVDPVKEIAKVVIPAVPTAGQNYRLNLSVGLSGSESGSYSRWDTYKGQPFYAEYLVPAGLATVDAFGAALATSLNKALKRDNLSDVIVSYEAATDSLVITATNEYQKINVLKLEVYNPATVNFDTVATGATTTTAVQGIGTSWFLTKNLRLPTVEAIRFMGTMQDERPVANAKYDQYSFELHVDRNITGQSAVGQEITSKTTHVFFVISSLSATFEGYLTSVFGAGSLVNARTKAVINP